MGGWPGAVGEQHMSSDNVISVVTLPAFGRASFCAHATTDCRINVSIKKLAESLGESTRNACRLSIYREVCNASLARFGNVFMM